MKASASTAFPTRDLTIIILFVLATSLPFINMPFHMDDPTHLDFARVQVEHPLQQDIPDYTYFGQFFESFRDTHPRGHSLLLSLLIRADPSEPEAPMHAAFLVFPLLAGISMYFLARRFGAPPPLSSLLLMSAPVVLATFHSLMTDPPGMAMWLASVTAYIYGSDRGWRDRSGKLLLTAATVFLLIGTLISYQVLSVIPLMLAYSLLKRRRGWREFVPLAVPAAVFLLGVVLTRLQYHGWPLFSYHTGMRLTPDDLLRKARAILVILGGIIIAPPVAWFAYIRARSDLLVALAATAVTAAIAVPYYLDDDLTPNQLILSILFAPITLLVLWRLLRGVFPRTPQPSAAAIGVERGACRETSPGPAGKRTDAIFLALWVGGVLFYCWIILPYASPRYLLPLAPPFVMLAARGLQSLSRGNRRALAVIGAAAVLLTLALSIPVAIADYDRAESYRSVAREISDRYATPGRTVWYDGELGFRYYMEKEGFQVIRPDNDSPRPGDVIIWANLAHGWELTPPLMARLAHTDTIRIYGRLPVVTLNYKDKSGLYGHRDVMLPYAFTRDFSEQFFVLEVARPSG